MPASKKNTLTPEDHARMKDEYSEDELRREEWEKTVQKGRQEGMEKGREEGRKALAESKRNIARNLLDILDDATIAQKTGLSEVERSVRCANASMEL